jgi:oxygen-independent coproporphyrinogen III oxidase
MEDSLFETYETLINTPSIYVHWPFCPYKCHFCPFVAIAGHDEFKESYHHALLKEIRQFGSIYSGNKSVQTIFLGGGTPSTYPDHLLLDTFDTLKEVFTVTLDTEITIEVNPGTVTENQLAHWATLGINRLSIGVQSLNDAVLKKLNRLQSADDVRRLIALASRQFDNISVDLIVGLPGVSDDEWRAFLTEIVSWPVKHISIYYLTVHEHTQLYYGVKNKKVSLPADEGVVDLYQWSIEFLKEHGIFQYELSNFARPGYESKHNRAYWRRTPYKGFGLGACSFDGRSRFQNDKNLIRYIESSQKDLMDVTIFSEYLSIEQIRLEKIMLGIRHIEGVSINEVIEGLTIEENKQFIATVKALCENGLLYEHDGRIGLTPAGLNVENEVVLKLS